MRNEGKKMMKYQNYQDVVKDKSGTGATMEIQKIQKA